MEGKFVRGKLVELYSASQDFVVMERWVGCCIDSPVANEGRFLHALQDRDAALALAREYKAWREAQKKEG